MNRMNKLKEAINNLTDLYEFGRRQADIAPAEFLEQVTNELKQLRTENERLIEHIKNAYEYYKMQDDSAAGFAELEQALEGK